MRDLRISTLLFFELGVLGALAALITPSGALAQGEWTGDFVTGRRH